MRPKPICTQEALPYTAPIKKNYQLRSLKSNWLTQRASIQIGVSKFNQSNTPPLSSSCQLGFAVPGLSTHRWAIRRRCQSAVHKFGVTPAFWPLTVTKSSIWTWLILGSRKSKFGPKVSSCQVHGKAWYRGRSLRVVCSRRYWIVFLFHAGVGRM